MAVEGWYESLGQGMHWVSPTEPLKCPVEHGLHTDAPAGSYPATHEQDTLPTGATEKLWHEVQFDASSATENESAGHSTQILVLFVWFPSVE
eukprot:CAMPEP_0181324910 /NCGR_PEP_ID=MMETSP1101-20121128/20628_1 /TAXON_ID=46948 /ORGANISM="Rhodomonas abbreviata, Strain Caron Lab Isolate" /LENGTH=91 /DNA_ID=CAMNT_0023433151 /DNA_START=685 /DNA_END=960 /DNA_ORIENTATION=-